MEPKQEHMLEVWEQKAIAKSMQNSVGTKLYDRRPRSQRGTNTGPKHRRSIGTKNTIKVIANQVGTYNTIPQTKLEPTQEQMAEVWGHKIKANSEQTQLEQFFMIDSPKLHLEPKQEQ